MAVVFDLDDTLYNERCYVASGRMAVARFVAQHTAADVDKLLKTIIENHPRGFEAVLRLEETAAAGLSLHSLQRVYESHIPDIRLRPDAEALLAALKARGTDMALLTDGTTERQRRKIEALGLDRFFRPEHIFISEECGADKSQPQSWRRLMECFPAQRFTYIGDNPAKDFRWPNLLGWNTVMLRDTTGSNVHPQSLHNLPAEYLPKCILSSFTHLQH